MIIKKKLTRKQFLAKEDDFIIFMRGAVAWVKKNINLIIFSVIGLFVLLAAIWGFRYKQQTDLKNSSRLLFEAQAHLTAMVEGETPDGSSAPGEKKFKSKEEKYAATIDALNKVIELYPSSSAAEDALFLKGEAYYQFGKYDEAAAHYNQYLEKYGAKGDYGVQSLASLGYIYEDKEDYPKAIDTFQRIINDYPNYLLRDTIFMELGRCYEYLKELAKAKEAYQKIVVNFSDSPLLKDAQQKLDAINLLGDSNNALKKNIVPQNDQSSQGSRTYFQDSNTPQGGLDSQDSSNVSADSNVSQGSHLSQDGNVPGNQ